MQLGRLRADPGFGHEAQKGGSTNGRCSGLWVHQPSSGLHSGNQKISALKHGCRRGTRLTFDLSMITYIAGTKSGRQTQKQSFAMALGQADYTQTPALVHLALKCLLSNVSIATKVSETATFRRSNLTSLFTLGSSAGCRDPAGFVSLDTRNNSAMRVFRDPASTRGVFYLL